MSLLDIQDSEKNDLSNIHDCEQCHGKIVCISVDNVGVTRCGYCNAVVNYEPYYRNFHSDEMLELIEKLKFEKDIKEAAKKEKLRQKKKRK